jgi:hypothetical protein
MRSRCHLLVLILAAIVASLGCTCPCISMLPLPGGDPMCREAPYSPPPESLHESDLVGTWETYYWGDSVDTLILRDDGTFKQIFRDPAEDRYRYETPWNEWWLEQLPDGAVRLHLAGARYSTRTESRRPSGTDWSHLANQTHRPCHSSTPLPRS